jgi:hypothetical protein
VHTAPVSIMFDSVYLTDTVTNLPITTHTPAPSLLDDGDIESQPGPKTVSPYVQYNEYQERQREFAEEQQATSTPYADEDVYSNSQCVSNGPESDYDMTSMAPILSDDKVADLLQHMNTAHGEYLQREQAQRMRALKHTSYVREMKPDAITESAFTFIS